MQAGHRKLLMTALVAALVTQAAFVYSDDTALRTPPLGELALAGRALWHRHDCQACHQLYGFGGFLGPDLTNAASRVNRARLDAILTKGSGQMPAFHFSAEQINAIEAFLRAIDRTGIGQARRQVPPDQATIAAVIEEHRGENPLSEPAAKGYRTFQTRCIACHTLFRATPLGVFLAPDLSDVLSRLGAEGVDRVLVQGRPKRGMVPQGLEQAQRLELIAFFSWLGENRAILRDVLGREVRSGPLPFWEFR